MPTKGSSCVVINQKGEVLLVLREDFRIWVLPGGGLEPNESWEEAAVRETLEETGYRVEIKQYVGEYWRPQMSQGQGDLKRVFLAEVVGGKASQHDKESIDVRWFPAWSLPKGIFRFAREHIQDALAGLPSPVYKKQLLPIWLAMGLRLALLLRNIRNRIFFPTQKRQEQQ
jgi:8-oxo-dGTP pyrophosphatase MutT (NUDIX family)